MTHPNREELAGRLEARLRSLALLMPAAVPDIQEAAAALRQSPTVEELETLAVSRLIEFANDVEGNTRARRMVLACERAKSLAQAIDALYQRGGG